MQSYLFFWDKLNKANYYLELSIQEASRPLDDRLISHLSGDLISDGGQWDMVVNLLEVLNYLVRVDGTNLGFGRTTVWFRKPFTLNPPTRLYLGL